MKFSVVIPACDRPEKLRECLRRVMDQRKDGEVIVSDDGRTDGAQGVVAEFPGARWIQGSRRGPAANRNHGAGEAKGEWLIFLDDDCLPEAGWLAAYEEAAANGMEALEGKTVCPMEDRLGLYEIIENLSGGAFWSCNLAVRRDKFVELGGFDEDFTQAVAEDMEFAWRMRKRGLKIAFVPKATVIHPPRRTGPLGLVKRAASHRWILLYRLKTGQGPRPGSFAPVVAAHLVIREYLDNLRMIYHLRRKEKSRRIRGNALWVLWRCVTLTWFLPYYIYWEMKWRADMTRVTE